MALIAFVLISINFSSALSLVIHVPEKYTTVLPGERFYFEIEVKYPENPVRKDLRLEYEIKTAEGKIIAQSKVLKAIETQASFMDFIVIPENAKEGLHTINIKVEDYESLNEEVGASFQVIGEKNDQLMIYIVIILGVILLVALLVIVQLIILKKKNVD